MVISMMSSNHRSEWCPIVLGVVSLLKDMGQEARLTVHIDSTSGKAIASRTGVGKVRHMDSRYLWLQEVKKSEKLTMKKILGRDNK